LLDSANLHVLRTEGDYSRYMKLLISILLGLRPLQGDSDNRWSCVVQLAR